MNWHRGASSRALAIGLGLAALPQLANGQTFTVTAGTTDTVSKTLTGAQTGTVEAGGTLRTSAAAITQNGAATAVQIVNSGTIESVNGRAFDTSGGSNNRTLTFLNNIGAVTRSLANDAIRINTDVATGTILIDNAGLIQAGVVSLAGSGQALDLRNIANGGASLTVTNRASGIIESLSDDAIRPGQNAAINNAGIIRSFGANTSGGANGTSDGIDAGARTGVVVTNLDGGLISGARHGITADANITVVNQQGGVILGRNGSGVGSDGAGTVTNYGRITGAYAGAGNIFNSDGVASLNGDGDGVDLDLAGTIVNYGIIEGTGAGGFDSGGRSNTSEGISIGGGTITNFGLISGAGTGIVVNNDTNIGRSGVAATTITNNAGATIIGQNGYAIRLENKLGDARDNDTIVNRGTIIGNGAIPDPNAVVTLQSGAVDPNSVGTLNGVVYTGTGAARFIRGDGSAIQMGEGADTLINSGVIIGNNGRAVNLEGGNDTMTVNAGSRITGLVNGGAGTDTLNYNKVGLTEIKRTQLQAGQTVNIGGTLYTSFETVNGTAQSFASFGRTPGAVAVGTVLDNLPATTPGSTAIVNALDALASATDIGQALDQVSPTSYQNLARIGLVGVQQTGDLVALRLTQSRTGIAGNDLSGAAQAFAMLENGMFDRRAPAMSRSLNETVDPFASLAYAPVVKAPVGVRAPAPIADGSLFLTSGLVQVREGARLNTPAFRATSASILGGVDRAVSERVTLGLFGGYNVANGNLDDIGSTARIRTGTIGGYVGYTAPTWYANLLAYGGWSTQDTARIALGTLNRASFGGNHIAARGTIGTDLVVGRIIVTPEASLQYTQVRTDAFTEAGGPLALNVAADRLTSVRSSAGLRFATNVATLAGGVVTPELRLAWLHEFADGTRGIGASFVDAALPGAFITATGSGLRDRALVGVGMTGRFGAATSLSLNYDALVGAANSLTHQVVGRARWVF